jgi:hypothetical protein
MATPTEEKAPTPNRKGGINSLTRYRSMTDKPRIEEMEDRDLPKVITISY